MKLYIIVCLVMLLSCVSCRKDRFCEEGYGATVQRVIPLSKFEAIDFTTFGEVRILKSTDHKVIIEGQQNIVGEYDCDVQHNELRIKSRDCFNTRVTPVLYVYCDNIRDIRNSGAGDIRAVDTFFTQTLHVKLSGAGDMDLFRIESTNAYIRISGAGNVSVKASDYLDANISGAGKIFYKGYPAIREKISGAGEIIDAN